MDPQVLDNRHPGTIQLARWFSYQHLPENVRHVSAGFHNLAESLIDELDDGPELTACLRKLLEAKDCAVRQALVSLEVNP